MDVPAALEGRTFSAPGLLAIEITDQDTSGVYQLTVDDDGTATCAPSTVEGDITMQARTLGSVYLGGRRINTVARAGRITGTASAIALADRMFQGERAPLIRDGF